MSEEEEFTTWSGRYGETIHVDLIFKHSTVDEYAGILKKLFPDLKKMTDEDWEELKK